ncbi:hypothetical protein FACS189491_03430 [Spirochaetia bacterium]|nr:hypothetical protein FACS189491_03430 [Spirochaetia bacterium]
MALLDARFKRGESENWEPFHFMGWADTVTLTSEEQRLNASRPISVTLSGMAIALSAVQR